LARPLQRFERLQARTHSIGLDLILEFAAMFTGAQLTFGSEPIVSGEHSTLEQASHIARGYTFVDAVADQKAFLDSLALESALKRKRTR
jgi:hypothetical protein